VCVRARARARPPLFVAYNVSVRACVRACVRARVPARDFLTYSISTSVRVCVLRLCLCRHSNG
jgi:hypothetical protein